MRELGGDALVAYIDNLSPREAELRRGSGRCYGNRCRGGCFLTGPRAVRFPAPRGALFPAFGLPEDELADLLVDERGQVEADDLVHETVRNDQPVAPRDLGEPRDGVSLSLGYAGHFDGVEMEEDGDVLHGNELAHELREDVRRHHAGLVEEDAKPTDVAERVAAPSRRQTEAAISAPFEEIRGAEPIRRLGAPLVLLSEAPQEEDAGQHGRHGECEPRTVGDLGQRRAEVESVDAREEQPREDNDPRRQTPDDERDECDHARVKEGDEHDAHAISIAEPRGIAVDGRDEDSAAHEQPVEEGHVQLTVERPGRVHNLDLGTVRQFHDLRDELWFLSVFFAGQMQRETANTIKGKVRSFPLLIFRISARQIHRKTESAHFPFYFFSIIDSLPETRL